MTGPDEQPHKGLFGGSLTFGLPQAIFVAILSVMIATAVAIANS